jgi:hypothetical protein
VVTETGEEYVCDGARSLLKFSGGHSSFRPLPDRTHGCRHDLAAQGVDERGHVLVAADTNDGQTKRHERMWVPAP